MASRPGMKMPRAQRAKQFMPFTLEGLSEALALKEESLRMEGRRPLTEQQAGELEEAWHRLKRGMKVRLLWYAEEGYTETEGTVREVDEAGRRLRLDHGTVEADRIERITFPGDDAG